MSMELIRATAPAPNPAPDGNAVDQVGSSLQALWDMTVNLWGVIVNNGPQAVMVIVTAIAVPFLIVLAIADS